MCGRRLPPTKHLFYMPYARWTAPCTYYTWKSWHLERCILFRYIQSVLYLYLEYDTEVISLQVCVDGDEISSENHTVHTSLEPAAVLVLRIVVDKHRVTTLSRLGPVPRATCESFDFFVNNKKREVSFTYFIDLKSQPSTKFDERNSPFFVH